MPSLCRKHFVPTSGKNISFRQYVDTYFCSSLPSAESFRDPSRCGSVCWGQTKTGPPMLRGPGSGVRYSIPFRASRHLLVAMQCGLCSQPLRACSRIACHICLPLWHMQIFPLPSVCYGFGFAFAPLALWTSMNCLLFSPICSLSHFHQAATSSPYLKSALSYLAL